MLFFSYLLNTFCTINRAEQRRIAYIEHCMHASDSMLIFEIYKFVLMGMHKKNNPVFAKILNDKTTKLKKNLTSNYYDKIYNFKLSSQQEMSLIWEFKSSNYELAQNNFLNHFRTYYVENYDVVELIHGRIESIINREFNQKVGDEMTENCNLNSSLDKKPAINIKKGGNTHIKYIIKGPEVKFEDYFSKKYEDGTFEFSLVDDQNLRDIKNMITTPSCSNSKEKACIVDCPRGNSSNSNMPNKTICADSEEEVCLINSQINENKNMVYTTNQRNPGKEGSINDNSCNMFNTPNRCNSIEKGSIMNNSCNMVNTLNRCNSIEKACIVDCHSGNSRDINMVNIINRCNSIEKACINDHYRDNNDTNTSICSNYNEKACNMEYHIKDINNQNTPSRSNSAEKECLISNRTENKRDLNTVPTPSRSNSESTASGSLSIGDPNLDPRMMPIYKIIKQVMKLKGAFKQHEKALSEKSMSSKSSDTSKKETSSMLQEINLDTDIDTVGVIIDGEIIHDFPVLEREAVVEEKCVKKDLTKNDLNVVPRFKFVIMTEEHVIKVSNQASDISISPSSSKKSFDAKDEITDVDNVLFGGNNKKKLKAEGNSRFKLAWFRKEKKSRKIKDVDGKELEIEDEIYRNCLGFKSGCCI